MEELKIEIHKASDYNYSKSVTIENLSLLGSLLKSLKEEYGENSFIVNFNDRKSYLFNYDIEITIYDDYIE